MFAKKCDRCGALFEIYNTKDNEAKPNGYMLVNIDARGEYWKHNVRDLCPACMGRLQAFLLGGAIETQKEE